MTTRQWKPGDCFVFLSEEHEDWIDTIYGQVLTELGGGRYRVIPVVHALICFDSLEDNGVTAPHVIV
jgi:hypothetical protein